MDLLALLLLLVGLAYSDYVCTLSTTSVPRGVPTPIFLDLEKDSDPVTSHLYVYYKMESHNESSVCSFDYTNNQFSSNIVTFEPEDTLTVYVNHLPVSSFVIDSFPPYSDVQILSPLTTAEIPNADKLGISIAMSDEWLATLSPTNEVTYVFRCQDVTTGWEFFQAIDALEAWTSLYPALAVAPERLFISFPTATVDDGGFMRTNAGYVACYEFRRTEWVLAQIITQELPKTNSRFGVSLSYSHNQLLVGAYMRSYDDGGGSLMSRQGTASVFSFSQGTWGNERYIYSSAPYVDEYFGWKVSISSSFVAVGTVGENVYVASLTDLGAVAQVCAADLTSADSVVPLLLGERLLIGNPTQNRVLVYAYSEGVWGITHEIPVPDSISGVDEFGSSLGGYDGLVAIGAPATNNGGHQAGAAFLYGYDASEDAWALHRHVLNDNSDDEQLGISIAATPNWFAMVGTFFEESVGNVLAATHENLDFANIYALLTKSTPSSYAVKMLFLDASGNNIGQITGLSVSVLLINDGTEVPTAFDSSVPSGYLTTMTYALLDEFEELAARPCLTSGDGYVTCVTAPITRYIIDEIPSATSFTATLGLEETLTVPVSDWTIALGFAYEGGDPVFALPTTDGVYEVTPQAPSSLSVAKLQVYKLFQNSITSKFEFDVTIAPGVISEVYVFPVAVRDSVSGAYRFQLGLVNEHGVPLNTCQLVLFGTDGEATAAAATCSDGIYSVDCYFISEAHPILVTAYLDGSWADASQEDIQFALVPSEAPPAFVAEIGNDLSLKVDVFDELGRRLDSSVDVYLGFGGTGYILSEYAA
eukprot:gnl/Chilomastix_cuspidata/2120.p1 GENE.gnl/Chilomastix_cuspidata/2120~~gnl/Chilomastix_cuspidata/2120.p1  ORF type:complete len:816 (+),score=141.78 gnl/Chilomastix_cuspidata/2120:28-2475(+)